MNSAILENAPGRKQHTGPLLPEIDRYADAEAKQTRQNRRHQSVSIMTSLTPTFYLLLGPVLDSIVALFFFYSVLVWSCQQR